MQSQFTGTQVQKHWEAQIPKNKISTLRAEHNEKMATPQPQKRK